MRKFKIFLITVLLAAFASAGCRSVHPAGQTTIQKSDTVFKEKTVFITDTLIKTERVEVTVFLPGDTIFLPVEKTVKNATLTLKRNKDGTVTGTCVCDTIAIKAQLRNEVEREFRGKTETIYVPTSVTETHTPGFTMFLAWSGAIAWTILIGYIIYRFRK